MKRNISLVVLLLLPLLLVGCSGADDKVDTAQVKMVLADFDGLPVQVAVNQANGLVQLGQIIINSVIVGSPTPGTVSTSTLQTIQLSSYEVVYSRADTGTRVPTPLVQGIFGSIVPGGSTTLDNIPLLAAEQLDNVPLGDLQFINGGVDQETGSQVVRLALQIRFFGRTLGGRNVVSEPQSVTIDFVP